MPAPPPPTVLHVQRCNKSVVPISILAVNATRGYGGTGSGGAHPVEKMSGMSARVEKSASQLGRMSEGGSVLAAKDDLLSERTPLHRNWCNARGVIHHPYVHHGDNKVDCVSITSSIRTASVALESTRWSLTHQPSAPTLSENIYGGSVQADAPQVGSWQRCCTNIERVYTVYVCEGRCMCANDSR
jgi:hypothetical protein